MLSDNLQRRVLVLVVWLAILSFLLFFMTYLQISIGFERAADGSLVLSESASYFGFGGTFLFTGFRVIRVILWMSIVIVTVRFLLYVIFRAATRSTGDNELSSLGRTVLTVVIYIVAFFIIFQTQFPGIQLAPLFTGSTILGIVVGLALQDTLGNLFAGIALQADKSFQVGDVITVPTQGQGIVEAVSWRGVKIRTFQDKVILISNSIIGKATIEVAAKDHLNARLVKFNTIYTTSPAKVISVVREAVRQVDNVSQKRRPKVRIWNLGDNGIDWEVKYWPNNYRTFNDTDALIRQRIWYAFQREGIDFAYPTRTIYTARQSDEEEVFVETADEKLERINGVAIFAPLSTEETERISRYSHVRVFAPEEPVIVAGEKGDSMFIVHSGSVSVRIKDNGELRTLNTIKPGGFFGEMGLLSGEPRAADVIADCETRVIEIRRSVLEPLFASNPELLRVIAEIVEERREVLESEVDETTFTTDSPDEARTVDRLRKFFGFD
ncbi:MAG: mechanosensitive ion channel family protein [Pyrinomonadaceae bacterium]